MKKRAKHLKFKSIILFILIGAFLGLILNFVGTYDVAKEKIFDANKTLYAMCIYDFDEMEIKPNFTQIFSVSDMELTAQQYEKDDREVYLINPQGHSMFPTIYRDKSLCLCVKENEYNVGDIVVYQQRNPYVWIQHRIVAKNIKYPNATNEKIIYTLKGDNNVHIDKDKITIDDIFCKTPEVSKYQLNKWKLENVVNNPSITGEIIFNKNE